MKIEKVIKSVIETRNSLSELSKGLPNEARSKAQEELMKAHGSPLEFSKKCISAVGSISTVEAIRAIEKYRIEWDNAY